MLNIGINTGSRSRLARVLGGVVLAVSMSTATVARSVIIDSFDVGQSTIVFTPDTTAENSASGLGILGGERDAVVTLTSGVGVTAIASGGNYSYGHIAGSEAMLSLVWDGADDSSKLIEDGLGGIDFTDGGVSNGFGVGLLFNDFGSPMVLTLYTDAVNISQASVFLPGDIPPDPQMVLEIPFADFSIIGGTGADFTNVGALVLDIDGSSTAGLDVEISSIGTIELLSVPEPSPAVLIAGGLVGISWIRRRRCFT